MLNNFIRARQETGSYCGPAVMQMLLSAVGETVSQENIALAYASKDVVMKEGIPLVGLAKTIKKLFPNLVVWQKYNSDLKDIELLVSSNYVVAFDWQGVFSHDEYGDEYWNFQSKWKEKIKTWKGIPTLLGDQGHYCVALEVDTERGYLRFADPYGHYAGKDRFVALWEFEERWWDDRLDKDESGKTVRVVEERLIFLVTKAEDAFPASLGMERA